MRSAACLAADAESTLVFAPHFNSYRRLRPRSYPPTAVAWATRTAWSRSAFPRPTGARPHRASRVGSGPNPYLVLAAILVAALIGHRRQMSRRPDRQRRTGVVPAKLPPDWPSAIATFESGTHVAEIFPAILRDSFVPANARN